MSIASRHAYRFGFLKSEEWQTKRLMCIAMDEGKCVICGVYDESNDAHHLFYRKQWNMTKVEDLLTVCRKCHKIVHDLDGDVLARDLWKFHDWIKIRTTPNQCSACYTELAGKTKTRMFPNLEKEEGNPILCKGCFDELHRKRKDYNGNPWRVYKAMKLFHRMIYARKMCIEQLRKFVKYGMKRQHDRVRFEKALASAIPKIKAYLLLTENRR